MTEIFYKTEIYEVDHTTFGGLIYPSDFNTNSIVKNNYNGSPIAKRIASDDKFDQQCKKNKMYNLIYGGKENA